MATLRRVSLPLVGAATRVPTVDAVRAQLGGRAQPSDPLDEVGALRRFDERARVGVVLFVRGDQLDLMTDEGRAHRVARVATEPLDDDAHEDPALDALRAMGGAARAFHALREGARVRFTSRGALGEGTLVERCRYGALVLRDDGSIVGVGFRALWAHDEPPSRDG